MAINQFTLNNLYSKGILDYVPYDLYTTAPVGSMQALKNPYTNVVSDYKNILGNNIQALGADTFVSGSSGDSGSFVGNNVGYSYGNNGVVTTGTYGGDSFQSSAGMNGFGLAGIGTHSQAGLNGFGNNGIGIQSSAGMNGLGIIGFNADSNAGVNGFGNQNIGAESNAGINAFGGGFGKLGDMVSNGTKNAFSAVESAPTVLKGLVAGTIVFATLYSCLKRGKKPKVTQKPSFWAKLNPKNWFKKKSI